MARAGARRSLVRVKVWSYLKLQATRLSVAQLWMLRLSGLSRPCVECERKRIVFSGVAVIIRELSMLFYEQQVDALCFRWVRNKAFDILLITSWETKRWVIPKDWPRDGEDFGHAAAREAFEEAGVKGRVQSEAVGGSV